MMDSGNKPLKTEGSTCMDLNYAQIDEERMLSKHVMVRSARHNSSCL